jgi:hypothetical protein
MRLGETVPIVDPEDGDSLFLWNVVYLSPHDVRAQKKIIDSYDIK